MNLVQNVQCLALAVTTALVAATSYGAACGESDYVEVKDWPAEKVEQAYCEAHAEMLHVTFASIGLRGRAADENKEAIATCESQIALYVRVLENIHKRRIPSCK
jgi:hypothetical protein